MSRTVQPEERVGGDVVAFGEAAQERLHGLLVLQATWCPAASVYVGYLNLTRY